MRLAPGTILRDRYQIVRKVDEDGEVFEARDLDQPGRFAIKFLCEGGIRNAVLLDGLRREALAASALGHPGIVRVHDLDQGPDGSPFIIMELLSGQSLAQLMRGSSRPRALSDVAVLVESIAAPLGEAHRRGIIHGDLSPGDVFVLDAEADPQARVKVLDFGVARIRAQAGGIVRGTSAADAAAYASPEQRQGRTWEVDERTDVFSLGAIARALVTGGGAAPPAAVAAVIARATSPHREGRFRTVSDLAKAMRAAVPAAPARASGIRSTRRGETPAVPVAPLHGETERVRKPAGMRRVLAAAVGCGLAILLGVVVTTKLTTRAPQPAAKAVAPKPVVAPPIAAVVAPPPKVVPPPPAPAPAAIVASDRTRQPLPPRERATVPGRRRSAHAGMSDEARREMEETYQKASRAFDLGNYDEAIAGYKRTYELGGDAPMLYNIAQALRLAKRPDEAAGFYRRYLQRAPSAANRDEVMAKLAQLDTTPAPPSPSSSPSSSSSSSSSFRCHWPTPAAAGKWIDVSCSHSDPQAPVARAFLLYRATGAAAFSLAELVKDGKGAYRGSIPPSAVSPKGLEVYVEGRRASGETVVQYGSATRPNTIAVTP